MAALVLVILLVFVALLRNIAKNRIRILWFRDEYGAWFYGYFGEKDLQGRRRKAGEIVGYDKIDGERIKSLANQECE